MIAHIRDDETIQSILEHSIGTTNHAKLRGMRVGMENAMQLTALLHDIGKSTFLFQDYINKAFLDPSSVRRGSVNHSSAGSKLIFETYYKEPAYKQIAAQLISIAIASHHGLIDCLDKEGIDKFRERINPKKEIEYDKAEVYCKKYIIDETQMDAMFESAMSEITIILKELLNLAKSMTAFSDTETILSIPHYLIGCLERLILSMLIDSDYTDTNEFMKNISDSKELLAGERRKLWSVFQIKLNKKLDTFTTVNKISELRIQVSSDCFRFAENPAGIYCLPVPTGGGKTLSSLRYALENCKRYNKERIIYVAPYLSILEQTASEIREILDADEYILEHHSNVIIESEDDINEHQKLSETWESPIILTTMVRLLNILFSNSQQDLRRMHRLVDSIIIIDEVQGIPIRLIHGFNTMMNFFKTVCNTTVILCSATQPLLSKVEKPIMYSEPINMIHGVDELYISFKRTTIVDATLPGGYNTEKLSAFILEKMIQVSNILIVLNTKSAVKKTYNQLQHLYADDKDILIIQLTTLMCAEHRSTIIKKLKNKLKYERIICISTQLIEAGVDISFQCVIRSTAGLDSIAQAAGRANRHGEVDMGYVYIINFNEENLSRLPDIKTAQRATEEILIEYKMKPENFDNDLSSPKAMKEFYELYFFKRKDEMDYNLKKGNERGTKLFDLLSINSKGRDAFEERNGYRTDLKLAQAFKTAGQSFEAIDSNTIGLIVPYKEAKDYIEVLKNSYETSKTRTLLKKLQRYTVNLYQNSADLKILEERHAIDHSVLNGAVAILREGFYSEEYGVSDELEDLIF